MLSLVHDLSAALGLGSHEHVAIVGAGGKTTLMVALAHELRLHGKWVVTATTTKVSEQQALEAGDRVVFLPNLEGMAEVKEAFQEKTQIFVCQGLTNEGKVKGIDPALADVLFQSRWPDHLVLEADGAAGRPLKVPAQHEPVVPPGATLVVAVAGLDAVGKRVSPEVVFRVREFQKVTRLRKGDVITEEALAGVFLSPHGLFRRTPERAKRVAFLNREDLAGRPEGCAQLPGLLFRSPGRSLDRLIIGSLKEKTYKIYRGSS